MSTLSDAIHKGRTLLAAAYPEDEVVAKLGRVLLEGTGITLADTYLVARDGTMVNQALHAGATLENLVAGPPALLRITDDTPLPPEAKRPWWQFWK